MSTKFCFPYFLKWTVFALNTIAILPISFASASGPILSVSFVFFWRVSFRLTFGVFVTVHSFFNRFISSVCFCTVRFHLAISRRCATDSSVSPDRSPDINNVRIAFLFSSGILVLTDCAFCGIVLSKGWSLIVSSYSYSWGLTCESPFFSYSIFAPFFYNVSRVIVLRRKYRYNKIVLVVSRVDIFYWVKLDWNKTIVSFTGCNFRK